MTPSSSTVSIGDQVSLEIGDQLSFIPSQQDAMVSRWNQFICIREQSVENVWDIQARGCIS